VETCVSCGQETPTAYPRCGHCGAQLAAGAPSAEIRCVVTIVTSDLKGSTALGEKLDPESLREILTLYFDAMRLVFESHGGTIEKIIGDAIVAVFGLPTPQEGDALRAVRAAAETQSAGAALNDQLDRRWGVRLINRTGIATGEVVVGAASAGEHILTGAVVQLANKLEQSAPPTEVLIGESTYEIVAERVTVEPVEPVVPKGSDEAIPAYRLVSVDARDATEAASASVTDNPDARICTNCGAENPVQFRHCGTCGAVLTVKRSHETRKTVTIVFSDLKATMLDGTPLSAAALRDVMASAFRGRRDGREIHRRCGDGGLRTAGSSRGRRPPRRPRRSRHAWRPRCARGVAG
jgi:class 3 adenylate cyclase